LNDQSKEAQRNLDITKHQGDWTNGFPDSVVLAPSLEIFKDRL